MDLNCYITIDGAGIVDQEVCITNAEQPLRGLVDRIHADDHLQLFALPVPGFRQNSIDAAQTTNSSDDFIIYLTIEGTDYENIATEISNPCASIRNLVDGIVQGFNLPKMDNGGNPCKYLIGIQEFIDTADLFILCWSANAVKSDYVELERQRALKRAFPQVRPIEEAKLSIYPISIEPRAELPVDMKDLYSFDVV